MIGNLIGLTTSIATTAAIGVARAGAAAATSGRPQVRTRTIVRDSRNSVATLIRALDAEKRIRAQLEFENAQMAEKIEAAEEVIEILMRERQAA